MSDEDWIMIDEFCDLLSMFEWATKELQGDGVTISRVYPAITTLKPKLAQNKDNFQYTRQLRANYLSSLRTRLDDIISSDQFLLLTFLDPSFGMKAFDRVQRMRVKTIAKDFWKATANTTVTTTDASKKQESSQYIYHYDEDQVLLQANEIDNKIN